MNVYLWALSGGVLIGLSTSMLLLFKGRIFGISGILGGVIKPSSGDVSWRLAILAGLVSGGALAWFFNPQGFAAAGIGTPKLVVAGLLVGFGSQLGGGCTSGHGVCGIGRMSQRSILATVTFMTAGMATVYLMKKVGV